MSGNPEPELPAHLADAIQFIPGQTPPSFDDLDDFGPAFVYPFVLQRDDDVTGVSGTGVVADGVEWHDGTVALRWRGERPSTVLWGSLADAIAVHGHDGRTRVVWPDGRRDDGAGPDHAPISGVEVRVWCRGCPQGSPSIPRRTFRQHVQEEHPGLWEAAPGVDAHGNARPGGRNRETDR